MGTDEINVSEQKLYKIGIRICSKTQKYSIAHNLFNFDRTIGMLHLKLIILKRGIQLNKNFSHLTYPVLTTTQNDEKLHILDSNSLVIISIWAYCTWRDGYRWDKCILNRRFRKMKWEYAVKLRNIQLLITCLILTVP